MNRKAFTIIAILGMVPFLSLHAQVNQDVPQANEDMRKSYESFRQQMHQEYESFRRQANEEYARFMEEAWQQVDVQPAEELPMAPKPPKPVIAPPEEQVRPTADPIPFDGVLIQPKPMPIQPQPMEPIVPSRTPVASDPGQKLYWYDTPLTFHFDHNKSLKLVDAMEKSVAELWRQLSDPYYDDMVTECLSVRKQRNLCDWAYVKLTETVAENCCGGHNNEAVVLHMYLLTQSGYRVRLARMDNQLTVLIGSEEKIYRVKYFKLDGGYYYNFNKTLNNKPYYIFNHAFPKEKCMSLAMAQPIIDSNPIEARARASKRYPEVKMNIELNKSLIDFYDSYPITDKWQYYTMASMSPTLKESLLPTLRKSIEGKTETETVNILLNFVQTAFAYATDDEQFGYERPLFPDESFYYPCCDCEDRSILLACLIRELTDLDVVLLDYPGHLATAIRFKGDVIGSYLNVGEDKYIICDPTYIGAHIGLCMPALKDVAPKAVLIQ